MRACCAATAWATWIVGVCVAISRTATCEAAPPLTDVMRAAFPDAQPPAAYSEEQISQTLQQLSKRSSPLRLGTAVTLTPNQPAASDGAHLSFWKPSFVIGTAGSGEAGFNFWNIFIGGHVNVAFVSVPKTSTLLDCRVESTGTVDFKIYAGDPGELASQGRTKLSGGHVLLLAPHFSRAGPVSVELWPNPENAPMGFFGCTLWPITEE